MTMMMNFDRAKQADIAFQANLYDDPNATRRGLHTARREWVKSALMMHLPPSGTVVEIGVGCGTYTRFLSDLGVPVTAVDNNAAFVIGVQNVAGVTPVLADATAPLGLAEHDLALCSEVLEHVPPERSLAMLRAIHGVLKPGGRLILTTPQRFATVELTARLLKFRPVLALAKRLYGAADELGHINLLTSRALTRQVCEAGFAIEVRSRFGFYLPVVAEFCGEAGQRALARAEAVIAALPILRGLIWTQAYVLKKV